MVSTPLFPPSMVIQVVAVDGHVIGRVRRDHGHWITTRDRGRPVADQDTLADALWALVEAVVEAPAMTDPRREERALGWIARHTSRAVPVARAVTLLGETPVVWCAVCAAAAAAATRDRRWSAFSTPVGTLALAAGARHTLAAIIGRAQPPRRLWRTHWSGPSCPSRHTTMATLGAGLIAGTLGRHPLPRSTLLAGATIGVGVGASHLVLGVHWPTDVLAGWAFAAATLSAARIIQNGHQAHGVR